MILHNLTNDNIHVVLPKDSKYQKSVITITTGINEFFTKEEWGRIKDDSQIKFFTDVNKLEVLKSDEDEIYSVVPQMEFSEREIYSNDIQNVNVKKARTIIDGINSMDALEKIIIEERRREGGARKTVLSLVNDRVKLVKEFGDE